MWGLYDTEEHVWIGNPSEDHPACFEAGEQGLAQVAAMMVDRQLGQPAGRTQARPLDKATLARMRLRDVVPTRMGPERALRELEDSDELD